MQVALLRMASPFVTPTTLKTRLSTRMNLPSGSAPWKSTSAVSSSMSADLRYSRMSASLMKRPLAILIPSIRATLGSEPRSEASMKLPP